MEKNKRIVIIMLLLLLLLIFIPLILNEFIFDNDYVTKVSNDAWASFFGSYIGGAIGGVGTLIAMYITLQHTQKQILESQNKDKRSERKKKSDEIVNLVADYLSDISVYYDSVERYIKKKNKLKGKKEEYEELLRVWNQFRIEGNIAYTEYLCELNSKQINIDFAKSFFEKRDNEYFEQNRMIIYREYEEILGDKILECEKNEEDLDYSNRIIREKRVVGCQSFWMLEIKLNGILEGQKLWNFILKLHELAKNENIQNESKDIEQIVQLIKEETYSFSKLYCII